jgi:hypothetical protein
VGAFDIIFDIHNVASLLRVMHVVPSPVTEAKAVTRFALRV